MRGGFLAADQASVALATPGSAAFEFDFKPPGYDDAGYGIGIGLPISGRFTLIANAGSDISPADESDISGVASRKVKTIEVTMSDGSTLTARPTLAGAAARHALPFVGNLRFFDRYFSGELEPQSLKALDKDGEVLDRQSSQQGAFY